VSSAASDDYIYTGKGTSSFAGFSTDADTVFIRNAGNTPEFTIIGGSYLKKDNSAIVSISNKVDYFTLKQEGNRIKFSIKGESSANILLNNTVATSVLRDGVVYTDWVLDQNTQTLKISTTLSEHDFEISSEDRLSVNSISSQTVNVSERLLFPLGITYTGKGVVQASASNLPQYATFNATSKTFSWTPDTNQIGNYSVTFTVTDGRLSDSSTVQITVKETNQAPVFEDIGNKTVIVRSQLQFAVNATDADGDLLVYSAMGLPANATFDPASHMFVWTPADNQAGSFNVTFNVSDGLLTGSRSVQISVTGTNNRAPVIGAIANASVKQKETLTVNVTASDPDGDVLTYSASSLPAGAKFDPATRQFTWSPTYNQAGNYAVTFRVTDGMVSVSRNVTFTAVKVNYAPYFMMDNGTTKTVSEGTAIQLDINASDWNHDLITYSATNLPQGATIDSATHTFSWTPGYDQAGSYTITLSASDGNLSASALLKIVVTDKITAGNKAPVFGAIANASVKQKETLTIRVTASDPDGDVLTYSASNLPAGAKFDPATRLFTWSPAYNQAGNYVVTFRVTDGKVSVSRSVTFTAVKVNYAPYFTLGSFTEKTRNEGYPIRLNINAADWNRDVIRYSATNLPRGATVDSATHTFLWTPGYDQAGTYNIKLIISDGKLQSSKTLRLIILDQPAASQSNYYIKLE
jgi:hypothetical protein